LLWESGTLRASDLKQRLASLEREVEAYRNVCRQLPSIEITYEAFTRNSGDETNRVLAFLGISACQSLQSEFVKMTPNRLKDAIANYDEVALALEGTQYASFLD